MQQAIITHPAGRMYVCDATIPLGIAIVQQ